MLTQILPHCWVLRCLLFGACIFLSPTFPLGCCQLRAPLPLPSVFWLLLSSAFEHIPSTWVTSVCLPFGAVGLPLRVLISSSPCSSCTLSLCIIVHSLSSHLSDLFSVSFPCVWVHVSLRLHPAPLPSSCVTPAENQFPVLLAFSLIAFLYSQAAWLGVSAAAFHSVSLPCSPSYSCLSCVIWLTCLKTVSCTFPARKCRKCAFCYWLCELTHPFLTKCNTPCLPSS